MTRVWELSQHKGSKLLLMLAIADHADDNGVAWPGLARLARKTRMSRRHTIRLRQQIASTGELWTVKRGQRSNLYVVTIGLTQGQLRSAAGKVSKLGGRSTTGDACLTPPPQVVALVTSCHPSPDRSAIDGDTAATLGMTPRAECGDMALSPDPSTTATESEEETDTNAGGTLWAQVLRELELQMAASTFDQWLRGTTARFDANPSDEGDRRGDQADVRLVITVRHAHARAWLEGRLRAQIESTVNRIANRPLPTHFHVKEKK